MTVPRCGVTHDVVIYDGSGNLAAVGLIAKPFSYRVSEAPTLVPRLSMGDPKGMDYEGHTSWIQTNFLGGEGQFRAPMPANNRYFDSQWFLPDRAEGYLGVSTLPWKNSITGIGAQTMFSHTASYAGVNTRYYREQRRGWHLTGIGWGNSSDTHDRFVTWSGVYRPGWAKSASASTCKRVAGWSNYDWTTVDACTFSSCAIIAVQGSIAGYVKPHKILVHTHSGYVVLPHGSTGAAALATYDSRLWRADWSQPQICYYDLDSVNNSITPQWSEYISAGADGEILAMTSFIGRLFIAKNTGIWAYEAGRTYQVVDLTHLAARRPKINADFSIFLEAHGALYWNIGNGLYRYTAGGLLEELGLKLDDAPVAAAVVRRGLALITPETLWVLDTNSGGLFRVGKSHKKALQVVASRGGELRVAPYRATWDTQEGVAVFTPVNLNRKMAGEPDFGKSTHSFQYTKDQVFIATSFVDLGHPGLTKSWRRTLVQVHGVPSSNWPVMYAYYRTVPTRVPSARDTPLTGFTYFGQLGEMNSMPPADEGTAIFTFPNSLTSQSVQVLLSLGTHSSFYGAYDRPTIYSIEIEGTPIRSIGRGLRRKRINLSAVVTDHMELLTGEMENSASFITTAIYSLAGSGQTHVIALPYPPPVGHTIRARVELGGTGAVVPILPSSYTSLPSGCPGSDISLVITEV